MPIRNRNTVFVLMMLMTGAHVLMKVLACGLLLRINQNWFIIYMSGDMTIFFVFKMLRDDLRYWLLLDGSLSWIVTFLSRVLIKTITDVTLIAQFRHPFELGGMYWSFNVALNQLFCFVSVYLYGKYYHASETMMQSLWMLVSFLFVFSMLNFLGFLQLINRKYIRTFFDTQTSKSFAVSNFHEAETDSTRFEIFGHHRSYYRRIEGELKQWLIKDWKRWMDDKPDWFDAAAVSSVPVDILPDSIVRSVSLKGLEGRRKSIDKMKAKEKSEKSKKEKEKTKKEKGRGGGTVMPSG